MKLSILFLSIFSLGLYGVQAQTIEDIKTLDINNLDITLSSRGDYGGGVYNTFGPKSAMPKGSSKVIGSENIMWINAITNNGEEHETLNSYRIQDNYTGHFFRGPISNNPTSAFLEKYNRVWKVSKSEIDYHKIHFNDPNYIIPEDIKNWPGNGDVTVGEAELLAPFNDYNHNGKYEPHLGDYPKIRGDQALFTIINDKNGFHNRPAHSTLNLEIHIMLYAYSRFSYSFANNSYFLHYEVHNRSQNQYIQELNFTLGGAVDLGYHLDDFIGTHVESNMVYSYNGDNFDEGSNGYGINPPAFGLKLLNNPLYSSYKIDNSQDPVNGHPDTEEERRLNMNGFYKNGQLQKYLNNNNEIITSKYSYPGTTDPNNPNLDITESNQGNSPDSRHQIITTRFNDISPGESICIDYAGIFARKSGLNNFEQVNYLIDQASGVQNLYNAANVQCSPPLSVNEIGKESNYRLYLNQGILQIDRAAEVNKNYTINLIDIQGKILKKDVFKADQKSFTMKIADLNSGTYFIQIQNETLKVIIP